MKTMVHILDSNSNGSLSCLFDDDTRFNIISLNDGVLVIEPYPETSIDTFAKKVFGCFQKGSTFDGIKTIKFVFNGIPLSIPHNVSSPEQIIQLYRAYSITTEYIAERAKYLKGESRKDRVTELVVHAVYTQKIQFKDEESNHFFNSFIAATDPSKSLCIISWVAFMQYLMEKHHVTVDKIADNALTASNLYGVNDETYHRAVIVLSYVWKYGDELKEWFNNKYEYEGTDIANPFVMRTKRKHG